MISWVMEAAAAVGDDRIQEKMTGTIRPEFFTSDTAHVDVETKSTLSYGQTVTDLYSDRQYEPKNARIYLTIDREKFLAIVEELLTK